MLTLSKWKIRQHHGLIVVHEDLVLKLGLKVTDRKIWPRQLIPPGFVPLTKAAATRMVETDGFQAIVKTGRAEISREDYRGQKCLVVRPPVPEHSWPRLRGRTDGDDAR